MVSHYVNGMGLGRHLMRRLVRWAKGRKVLRVYGDVLESNLPMQALAQSLGFPVSYTHLFHPLFLTRQAACSHD